VQDKVAAEARDWGAELIVLGTHGRRGAKRMLLGSGAERILRVAPVPVLLVRAPDEWDAAEELLRASASALATAGE
jgi:nucleotide-binding universal stress UspA family protein